MGSVKLGVWNVEWMNDLFESGNGPVQFKDPGAAVRGPRSGNTVRQRIADIAGVIDDLACDALVVVEGPNRTEELQFFFDNAHVAGVWECAVQRSIGQSQCIGIAVRTDTGRLLAGGWTHFDALEPGDGPGHAAIHEASAPFDYDSDDDDLDERHKFERRPLYAELTMGDGAVVRVIGLHLKSKGIFNAIEWSKWWRTADANRMRLIAQCRRFRDAFIEPYLSAPATQDIPLVICGDINDGPGFDTSEARLRASGVETLAGDVWRPDLTLGNALYDTLDDDKKLARDFRTLSTTRYKDPIFADQFHHVWIDHLLYSRNAPDGWVSDGQIHRNMPGGQPIWRKFPTASDHYPVSATIELQP